MIRYMPFILMVTCLSIGYTPSVDADDFRVVYETEIDAGIDEVWNAFVTKEGIQSWMAPMADIDLAIGGKMKSNYNPDGEIGDENTIENTILSYDPRRMLSLKATKSPAGFPFAEAAKDTWSIFYFSEISPTRTKITVVGLGYTNSEESQKMREFFTLANKQSLDKLKEALGAQGSEREGS